MTIFDDSNTKTPLYGGSTVKLGFFQKPYILKDGVTYGSSLKLLGVQVVALNSEAGVNSDDLSTEQVADLFGETKGFKASEVSEAPGLTTTEDDDF